MQYELILMIEGLVIVGPISKNTGHLVSCLSFTNAILGDFEVINKLPAYTTFRASERVVAFVIPAKALRVILDNIYPELKKEIIAMVCHRHI